MAKIHRQAHPNDFQDNELLNVVLQKLLAPPIVNIQGKIYYDSVKKIPFFSNGVEWVPFFGKAVQYRYLDESSLLADQNIHVSGFLYYQEDIDVYFEYLGTTTGTKDDYRAVGGYGVVQAGVGLSVDLDNKIQLGDGIGIEYTPPTTIPDDTGINDSYLRVNGRLYGYYSDALGNNLYIGTAVVGTSWRMLQGSFYNNRHFSNTSRIDYNSSQNYWEVKQEDLIYTTSGLSNFVGSNKGILSNGVYYYLKAQYNFDSGVTEEYALQLDINKVSRASSFAKFNDTINNKGLEYGGDYESNFTSRSLVTKQYVDAQIGSDKNYIHNQSIPSSIWSINHNLNKFPSITIVDSGGTEVEGDVDHVDQNNITVTFSASFSGKAYIN